MSQFPQGATEEVGQAYTITFDLGVIMKAMPIIWKNHTGYAKILVEANRVTSGCLQWMLSEKIYAKLLWCMKAVSEGLERLLFQAFMDDLVQDSPHHTSNIAAISTLSTVSPYA